LCYRLCGQLGKVPCPQPLFSAVTIEKTASEGKVELLTVPLSGRNGRFFLAEFFGLFDSRPASLYQTERQLDNQRFARKQETLQGKGGEKWKGTKRKRSWLS
jgi:hypothetical protein